MCVRDCPKHWRHSSIQNSALSLKSLKIHRRVRGRERARREGRREETNRKRELYMECVRMQLTQREISQKEKNKYHTLLSRSDVSDFLRPHGLQHARLLCSWGFSRQDYWSGLPFPSSGDLSNQGLKPKSPALQADSFFFFFLCFQFFFFFLIVVGFVIH